MKKLETMKNKSYKNKPYSAEPGDWLVVVDDSNCTVRLGGPGYMWRLIGQSPQYEYCWMLEGVCSPYDKSIFRKATKAEILQKQFDLNHEIKINKN